MKISQICTLIGGYQGKINPGDNYKLITLKDVVRDEDIKYDSLQKFSTEKINKKYILRKGDIILKAKSGDNTAILIDEDIKNLVASTNFIIIRINDTSLVSAEYLTIYLNSKYAKIYFKNHAEGTAASIVKIKILEQLEIKELESKKQEDVIYICNQIRKEKLIMNNIIKIRELQLENYLEEVLE